MGLGGVFGFIMHPMTLGFLINFYYKDLLFRYADETDS